MKLVERVKELEDQLGIIRKNEREAEEARLEALRRPLSGNMAKASSLLRRHVSNGSGQE